MAIHEKGESWKMLYIFSAIAGLGSVAGGIFDIVAGSMLGGLAGIPADALSRFAQFAEHPWLGLYYLDLLNCMTTFLMLPVTLSVCAVHRKSLPSLAAFTLVLAVIGTTLFLGGNSSLSMLSLSKSYEAADDARKVLLAAAAEAMIARGEHGGPAVFPAFMLCASASFLVALMQFKGNVFSKMTSVFGMSGNSVLMVYLVCVTFFPGTHTIALVIAAPGGILALLWTVLTSVTLIRLAHDTGGVR